MSAISQPMAIGERIACYTILNILQNATSRDFRRYEARAECCGLIVDRKEEAFKEARKRGATCCARCARQQSNRTRFADYPTGEQFGATRIVGRGEEQGHWRVIWDCCGKESTISQGHLHRLKNYHAQGRSTICTVCAIARKRRERPSRLSRRKADLAASRGLGAPIRQPRTPIPQPLITPIAAQLPTGIVSAAIAWPRPGRASA